MKPTIGAAFVLSVSSLWLATSSGYREGDGPADELASVEPTEATVVPYAPDTTPSELGLAGYAKVLCSAVFVSRRDPNEARHNSGYFLMPERDRDRLTDVTIDYDQQRVSLSLSDGLIRTAGFHGDQGCIIHPMAAAAGDGNGEGEDEARAIFFEPERVETSLPNAMTESWPMGDLLPDVLPEGVDARKLSEAVDIVFQNPESLTAAFVVLYKGEIVAERYALDVRQDTQLESWSMGKSITATLIGLLIQDGSLRLDQPAPVPEWQGEDDPRREITIENLMRMSSGLHFTAPRDPDYSADQGYPDHMFIYTGAVDAFEHSYSKPLQFPPGTEGRYRNSDPLTLGYIIKRTVEARGESYLTYPQRALFDKIGIRQQVLETDPYGNFLLTGYDYGTARNWARLGLLYLRDGVWLGERLLPEGFVEFVSTPAPAWSEPVYGGLFWLNRTGTYSLPEDAYYMAGGGGQRTFIVPSHDLVIVRMGHFRGDGPEMQGELNRALEGILGAVEPL